MFIKYVKDKLINFLNNIMFAMVYFNQIINSANFELK